MLIRIPDEWSFEQAAAIPEVWLTAFVNLFLEGDLKAGETVLLHAGASGVGTAAIQLAKAAGATVVVTAGAAHKLERCLALGADAAINYKSADFAEETRTATDGAGVDLVLDPVGGPYLARNISLLKRFGRLVSIGLLGGATGDLNMAHLLRNRLRIVGSTLRTRPVTEKIAITRQFEQQFWHLFADGTLQPIIDTTFPIESAQAAHDYVRANKNTGKVILKVGS